MTRSNPDEYLYRGTSRGWEGTHALQSIPMTCASSDPLVATLFACLARSFGEGVILVAVRDDFQSFIGDSNFFEELECAVNLRIKPIDFANEAYKLVPVDQSIEILVKLGFVGIPRRLYDPTDLRKALITTQNQSYRLHDAQILDYNLALEELS